MFLEQHCNGTFDTELSFEYSQPIRPKQFYADLDESLDGLNRDDFTKELLRLFHNDHSKLLDYRDRLAERVQALPNCPQTRLVNRRNSSTGTRKEKCTNDCYVLYAYNHGVHDKKILEIFTNANTHENETIVIKDDEEKEFIPPDMYGILVKLQSDVVDIKKRQAMGSLVLESVRTNINSTLVLVRTIHGTLNSVLSRVGSLSDTLRQNTMLLDDCAQVEQSLSSLQHRLNGNAHNACSINGTTAPTTLSATRIADAKPRSQHYRRRSHPSLPPLHQRNRSPFLIIMNQNYKHYTWR